ncbi:exocyst complex protein Exo70, Cullin repeat-like-containing domain protein [Artemisia annua]|uniref:Exocyst subunit Exo70 family protein n=1 Tax=Artemisia annua TaxID=35608 RepID=A0A2U1ME30_ARTAN|nr:exocyst complex protein Exo70, Cullin repeat-like-containing domain protein [Artemisia annua]
MSDFLIRIGCFMSTNPLAQQLHTCTKSDLRSGIMSELDGLGNHQSFLLVLAVVIYATLQPMGSSYASFVKDFSAIFCPCDGSMTAGADFINLCMKLCFFAQKAEYSCFLQCHAQVCVKKDDDDIMESMPDVDHDQILAEIDAFIDDLANVNDKGSSPEHPDDMFLHESIKRLRNLKNALADFSDDASSFDMINKLMQRAMVFMAEELQPLLLDNSKAHPEPELKAMSSKHFSFKQQDRCPFPEPSTDDDHPGFLDEKIRNALYEQLKRLDFEKLNVEDVQKLNWDWVESDVSRWIRIINLIISLLDYAATIAMTKRSAERLFKFLDMYEALHDLSESMRVSDVSDSGETKEEQSSNDLSTEILSVTDCIGEGAVNIFGEQHK